MKIFRLDNMIKGWFVGNFEPTALRTSAVEVAVKYYNKGAYESKHHHLIATEVTVVVSGRVKMNEAVYSEGDIVVLLPGESSDFEALEDAVTTVVKYPGVLDDKYSGDPGE